MTTPFPIERRFEYPKFNSITFPNGKRVYLTPNGDKVPSVTTILSATLPKEGLEKWRQRVGQEKAKKITAEACYIGSTMHDCLEGYVSNYLQGRPNIPPTDEEQRLAYQMAERMVCNALVDLNKVWGIEEALFFHNGFAGRTDLVGVYDGKSAVIDYKSAIKPKKPEWVESYKLQIAAYNLCHKAMFGEGMESGVILIAIRPPFEIPVQRFVLNKSELDHYEDKFLKLVEIYFDNRDAKKASK